MTTTLKSEMESEFLADALAYDAAVKAGLPPARAIAERRGISERTAQGRIAKAERLGFLTDGTRGMRDRRLTWRAKQYGLGSLRIRLVGSGWDGTTDEVWARYDLWDEWLFEARGRLDSYGPRSVRVWPAYEEDGEAMGTHELRSLPLQEARKELTRLAEETLSNLHSCPHRVPPRMRSPEDWEAFATAYRWAASVSQRPKHHLARTAGLSLNTIGARVRRASELGLLDGVAS